MDKLKENTPELSKIEKENPFRIPENYFGDFSARLQMKIEAEKKVVQAPKNRIIYFLKPAISLAASFALIFMLVYWPLRTFSPNQVAENNEQKVESYDDDFYSLLENIDDYTLYAWMDEQASTTEFSDDDLMNYLSTNMSEYEIYLVTDY